MNSVGRLINDQSYLYPRLSMFFNM